MLAKPDLPSLLQSAISAAEAAGSLFAAEFARPEGPRGGGGHAAIDREVEGRLRCRLHALFPARWRGEETEQAPPAPGLEAFCWLVDPNDGTSAFRDGHRGSAIAIALLRDGVPILGVVHAPLSPDRGPETFAWAEGMAGILRNGRLVRNRLDGRSLAAGDIVFVSQGALERPVINTHLVAPARFIGLASIAYRLARVAAGDGIAAVSLAHPVGWDYAAGHALLR
ncbi:MAG: hypothetical protein NZ523_11135, partial [Elioraea sp.]|nr:hypothetical protein [Elioraea sp.]